MFRIEDGDLCLRAMTEADAAEVQRIRMLPGVDRYSGWRPRTVEEVAEIARDQAGRLPGSYPECFQIVVEWQGRIVGDLAAVQRDQGRQCEVGIALDPGFQGRGLGARSMRLLTGWLFAAGLHRLVARVDPRNVPSMRLFERLGWRREGTEVECYWDADLDEWSDEAVFARLAREQ